MAKATPDAVLDSMADTLIADVTQQFICSAQPANFAGIAAVDLAVAVLDGGDLVKANGDVSGRKVTIPQIADIDILTSGEATHIVLASADTLLYVTTCTAQELTDTGTVTAPAWDIEIADPV